jgi:hypothetical protein
MDRRAHPMEEAFAIIPDGSRQPTALFTDLEDATEWALEKYGSDRFSIRYYPVAVSVAEPPRRS